MPVLTSEIWFSLAVLCAKTALTNTSYLFTAKYKSLYTLSSLPCLLSVAFDMLYH